MLTDQLKDKLAAADRGFQRQRGLTLGLQSLGYLLALVVVLFAADVALHLQSGWRLALSLGLLGALLAGGAYLYYLAQVRTTRPETVARRLEERDATLGSSLINSLQLRQHASGGAELTRTLAERAIGGYAAALRARDFEPLTRPPTRPREVRRALLLAGAFVLVMAVLYPITTVEFLRFLDPFGDHPPYSFTQVEIVDPADNFSVDYNGHVVINARTKGHRPDDLFLRFHDPAHPEKEATLPMYNKGEAGFLQEIEGVKSDLVVSAATKNGRSVSKSRLIRVGLVPKIEKAFARVTPPAYTGLPARENKFDFKNLSALVGSKIDFRLQSNRPLSAGEIALAEGVAVPMKSTGPQEVSGSLEVKESARLQFSVTDTAGLVSQENPSAPLTATYDLPPEISIDAPAQDGFVCDDFVLEVRISARDDYGLKTVRVHRALNEIYSEPKVVTFPEVTTSQGEALSLNIKELGVEPGDTISIFADTVDTCPEPHLAQTRTLRLMVVSTADYNNFLRERTDISDLQSKYSALLNEFHDRIDEQKALTDKIRELEEKAKDPAAAKELAAQLDKLMAQQAELNKKLGALADHMENFVRKEPLYDMESELQKELAERADKIRNSVAENDATLQKQMEEAAKGGAGPQQQKDALAQLEKESQKQSDTLEPQARQAEEQTMPPLKDAALMNALVNDFNAVKYLHETQSTLAAQAKAYENRGASNEEDKLALKQLAATEKAVQWALDKVGDNLREHAEAAEKTFPKAAQGGRDLADAIEERQLSSLAGKAANTMLAGDGAESSARATRLQEELDKLFADTQPASGQACKEFDQYLQLKRGLSAGNTFDQMSKSRKFGLGSGQAQGQGNGQGGDGGLDGYAASSSGNFGVFGNETFGGDPKAGGQGQNGLANAAGAGQKVDVNGADSAPTPGVNRLSGSTQSEATMDEYRRAIDAYFNSITK